MWNLFKKRYRNRVTDVKSKLTVARR